MTALKTPLLVAAFSFVVGCAHPMTGDDHRSAAAADMASADRSRAKFNPEQTAMAISPVIEGDRVAAPVFYNPTASHLNEADKKMASAFDHLDAARKLEKYEDAACVGITVAERTSCPLIAPYLDSVEEGSRGVVLHLKSAEKAKTLSTQMRCHLAFAQSNNFDRAPCPLYVKGVAIALRGDKAIEVASGDENVAIRVREEARKMFGRPRIHSEQAMKKILVAVDGSAPSLHAAKMALELSKATGAALTAVYSVPPMALPGEVPFMIVNDVVKADLARGKNLLEETLKELGASTAQTLLLEGSPAERIAETAEAQEFDLVVVGSRGRNAVARLFLGSVADRLVHICKKPVLVVR